MRRFTFAVLGLSLFAVLAGSVYAQDNPRGTARTTVNGKAISVEYGRPALKGRTVQQLLDRLKPGDVWRLGADKSTTFATGSDLVFGDVTIPKGAYSLWARREADNSWNLVFNSQHGIWGTKHDPSKDLNAVPLKETKTPQVAETVTLGLAKEGSGGVITIQWGDMKLSAEFKAK